MAIGMKPSPDLVALVAWISEDPRLLRQLSAEETSADFAASCAKAAEARGWRVTPEEILGLIRFHGRRWLERNAHLNAPSPASRQSYRDWTPIHVFRHSSEPLVLWSRLGVERFDAPFFEQTVSNALRKPLAALLQRTTSIPEMIEIAEREPARDPAGFIFHVSRCGSTLISQMFARLSHYTVISEAQPMAAVFNDPRLTASERRRAFAALIRLYGRGSGGDAGYLIKFEPRHLLAWREITDLFPRVPRIVVFRDPVEVLVSIFRSVPESAMLGAIDPALLGPPPSTMPTNEEHAAFVISRFFGAAAELAGESGSLAVNYRTLPESVFQQVAPHFGLTLTASDQRVMGEVTNFESKDAGRRAEFTPDSAAKQSAADGRIRELARSWFAGSYAALKAAENQPPTA